MHNLHIIGDRKQEALAFIVKAFIADPDNIDHYLMTAIKQFNVLVVQEV